jgi:hypothetical protein
VRASGVSLVLGILDIKFHIDNNVGILAPLSCLRLVQTLYEKGHPTVHLSESGGGAGGMAQVVECLSIKDEYCRKKKKSKDQGLPTQEPGQHRDTCFGNWRILALPLSLLPKMSDLS